MNFLISLKRRLNHFVLGGFTLLAALGYQTAAMAATLEATKSKPPAAVSGDLAIYTAWDERDINALIAGFNKVYPNVKVGAVRSEGGRGALLERLLTEIDSGKALADVYSTGIPDMSAMLQRGDLLSYRSASESNIDPRFLFKDGLLHPSANLVFMTAYNRTLIPEKEVPRTWEDLLTPKWKGKIAIDQEPNDIVAGFLILMGKEKGRATCASFRRILLSAGDDRFLWSFWLPVNFLSRLTCMPTAWPARSRTVRR